MYIEFLDASDRGIKETIHYRPPQLENRPREHTALRIVISRIDLDKHPIFLHSTRENHILFLLFMRLSEDITFFIMPGPC